MGTQLPLTKGGTAAPPHFLAHVYCGQTAGWIKMPLGMEVGLGPDHIVRWRSSFPQKGAQPPRPDFWPMSVVAKELYDQHATW